MMKFGWFVLFAVKKGSLKRMARLQCLSYGYHKSTTTETIILKMKATIRTAAHRFF